jgi:raffinose/stachyose/melibiose transport system permease protein
MTLTLQDTAPSTAGTGRRVPKRGGRRRRRGPSAYVVLVALVALAAVMLIPFGVVLLNAVKTPEDYSANGPLALPGSLSLDGVTGFWERVGFGHVLFNSVLVSGSVAILAVLLSVLNAYALGIGRIKGRMWVLAVLLLANTLPQEALVYPLYYLSKEVGLYNSRLAIVIVFTAIQSAFGTYLLSSVYAAFPREMLEAAAIDGAGKVRTLWRVVVPISWPSLSVLFTFFFIWTWNEFFLPLVFLISNDKQTVPVALGVLQGDRLMDATTTSASALLGILPAVLFFLIFQRTLSRGVMSGAIK